jgi:hypothetical protein
MARRNSSISSERHRATPSPPPTADPILDRTSQANINWNADEEKQDQSDSKK